MTGAELLPHIKATSKGERYSENFMKWVRKHRNEPIVVAFSQYSHIDGSHVDYIEGTTQPANVYIGKHFDSDKWFYGSRLSTILGSGARAEIFAMSPAFKMILLPDWVEGYIKGGKCFIDPDHRYYHDKERWQVSEDGNSRVCLWCGEYRQQKVVKKRVVEDISWVAEGGDSAGYV